MKNVDKALVHGHAIPANDCGYRSGFGADPNPTYTSICTGHYTHHRVFYVAVGLRPYTFVLIYCIFELGFFNRHMRFAKSGSLLSSVY